jgi:hypothetical protein
MEEKRHSILFDIFIIILILSIVSCSDRVVFNNGYCSQCEGQYELLDIDFSRLGRKYIYKCNTCGNFIAVSRKME